ncbi:MAG: hypothetical protein QOE55_2861 [Acidobacteriaceae bacterium]|jgi:hypothetical protein|nr:hypothetical protein [Acidobacteriaceae bacterium]
MHLSVSSTEDDFATTDAVEQRHVFLDWSMDYFLIQEAWLHVQVGCPAMNLDSSTSAEPCYRQANSGTSS